MSSGWLSKSHLQGEEAYCVGPNYRPHSLLNVVVYERRHLSVCLVCKLQLKMIAFKVFVYSRHGSNTVSNVH